MPARFRARGASASRPRAGDGAERDGRDSIAAFPARSPAIVAGFQIFRLGSRRGMCVRERTGLAQSTTKTLAFLALVGGAIV